MTDTLVKKEDLRSRIKQLEMRYLPRGSMRRSLASGTFWSLAGAVSSRGLMLVSTIIIARLLGKAGFGMWGLVTTTISMFAQFASFGVALTATKHVAELRKQDPGRAGRLLSLTMVVGLISTVVMSLISLALSGLIANRLYHIPGLYVPLMLSSVMLFGMVTSQMLGGALTGFEDFRYLARISVIQGVLLVVVAVPLTWKFGISGSVIGISIAYGVTTIQSLVAVIRKSRLHNMPLGFKGIWQERYILWQYALPSFLTGAVTGPSMVLSRSFVANVASGIVGLGGMTAALRWRDIILFIPGSIKSVTLPMLSRLKGERDYHRYVKVLWANIGVNGGAALAGSLPIMIFSPWVLSLYGPGFSQDWDMMVVLVGSSVFQAVNDVVTQVTASMEKMWWNFNIHIVWGAIVLGGSYLLVPTMGVRGHVYAFVAATFVHMVLNTIAAMVLIKKTHAVR